MTDRTYLELSEESGKSHKFYEVTLDVYKDGNNLRVRVVSSGFERGWNVQFPKELRHEGAKYVVDEIRESARGGFYRAHGSIRRLVTA